MPHVHKFLEAFDSVIALSPKALASIPIYGQIGAIRWEIFRVQRIAMQDPDRYKMRSPQEFQSLRQDWQATSL